MRGSRRWLRFLAQILSLVRYSVALAEPSQILRYNAVTTYTDARPFLTQPQHRNIGGIAPFHPQQECNAVCTQGRISQSSPMAGDLSRLPSKRTSVRAEESLRRADARRLGGRLKWPAMTEKGGRSRQRERGSSGLPACTHLSMSGLAWVAGSFFSSCAVFAILSILPLPVIPGERIARSARSDDPGRIMRFRNGSMGPGSRCALLCNASLGRDDNAWGVLGRELLE